MRRSRARTRARLPSGPCSPSRSPNSAARTGRRLLVDLQDRSHLDPEFCLVAVANGQIVLTAPGEEFYERVDWSGDEPAAWRPHEDSVSPVRVNPLVRFGMPAIGGISTEAIAGELDSGASLEEVADDFGLDIVKTAVAGTRGADRSGIVGVAWGMSAGYAAVFGLTSLAAFVPRLGLGFWISHQGRLAAGKASASKSTTL